MQNYHYSYLVGALIFGAAWLACYLLGRNYRAEIRWGTVISAPMALTSILFVPQYWTPPSLFNLDQKIRVGIEDFLWAAAVGGIASVVAYVRSDLIPTMFTGALSFTVLYFALFLVFLFLYPGFVQRYYNVPNLLGIYIAGVPIEELLFAGTGGAIWSVGYEYVQG